MKCSRVEQWGFVKQKYKQYFSKRTYRLHSTTLKMWNVKIRRYIKNRWRKTSERRPWLYFQCIFFSSCDDVVLWFEDLWEWTGTATVVLASPFIPFVLISWIGYNVLDIMCVCRGGAECSYGHVLIVKRQGTIISFVVCL